jgi:hypothetical protein
MQKHSSSQKSHVWCVCVLRLHCGHKRNQIYIYLLPMREFEIFPTYVSWHVYCCSAETPTYCNILRWTISASHILNIEAVKQFVDRSRSAKLRTLPCKKPWEKVCVRPIRKAWPKNSSMFVVHRQLYHLCSAGRCTWGAWSHDSRPQVLPLSYEFTKRVTAAESIGRDLGFSTERLLQFRPRHVPRRQ